MKKTSKIILGLILIGLGILFLGNSMSWWFIGDIDGWWTLFIIVPALIAMVNDGPRPSNCTFLLLGAALFMRSNGWLTFNIWYVVIAAFLIMTGLSIIFGTSSKRYQFHGVSPDPQVFTTSQDSANYTNVSTVFGECNRVIVSDDYQGGKASSVFGTVSLDLRQAKIGKDIGMTLETTFGTIRVILPEGIRLNVNGTPFLGSVNVRQNRVESPDAPMVFLSCSVAFGNIEII